MPVKTLQSWKEIAQYLGRGVRTVQRWEATYRLPVHRPAGRSRSAVYALEHEVDGWLTATGTCIPVVSSVSTAANAEDLLARLEVLESECGRIRQVLGTMRKGVQSTNGDVPYLVPRLTQHRKSA